ncbi:hypothetical protein [Aliidiomarina quisquiliarum]|uniref:hypothetical protein n=1 Tax=Aliidiomarina quisquiliarum TaxID=2938947 RepID=UPI00208F8963|nr:hypothetical protein [Aliidiomarina quisquiliarum]MCO4320006.1 hypothetical protein [Aliidiomarina quisquiliarum]
MNYINLTPHDIILNDGRKFEATGNIARVSSSFTDIVDDVCEQRFGEVQGLPEAQQGVRYIVSGMVLAALKGSRPDVVSPATGHSETKRNDKGHIVSVPCFVRGA